MKTLDEALAEILIHVPELDPEILPLRKCMGQALAEHVCSEYDLPMVDLCGPDGYAVRSEDISAASSGCPAELRIIGTNRAGHLPRQQVKPGTAVRVMTGSPVPLGADCIVPFEATDEPGNKSGPGPRRPSHVKIFQAVRPGANINRAGSNVREGSVVVPQGTAVGPAQISTLASVGKMVVKVIRRPRVAIIATGDELISLRSRLRPGKAYDSNGAALAALVAHYGGIPLIQGIARDSEHSLTERLRRSLGADAIITSGGVSKGDYDLVRLVLDKLGRVVFSRLRTGPGASFAFGVLERDAAGSVAANGRQAVPVFAVAGPPVGCLINFETLVRPALLKMMGSNAITHPIVDAAAADAVVGKKPMSFIKWTRLQKSAGGYQVAMNISEERGMAGAMATANSLSVIPEGTEVAVGDRLEVLPLDWTRW